MSDEPSWPTEDDDADEVVTPEQLTVQVTRPPVDEQTLRMPITAMRGPTPPKLATAPPGPAHPRLDSGPLPVVSQVTVELRKPGADEQTRPSLPRPVPPRPQPPAPSRVDGPQAPVVPPPSAQPEPDEPHAEPERFEPVKRSRRPLMIVGSLILVAVLGAAGAFAVNEFGGPPAVTTQPPAPAAAVKPMVKPVGKDAPAPTAAGIKAALATALSNGNLAPLTGTVVDPMTGTSLWQQGETTPATPASALKVLTAAAVLLELDHTAQLSTKVVAGPAPGSVVIVGGGDPTLASKTNVYPGAPTLDDLATQVKAKGPVSQVFFDLGRYSGEPMAPGWDNLDIAGGSITPIVPLTIDGGRVDPTDDDGARVPTPAQTAADAFAQRLGVGAATAGVGPQGAQVLGEVKSQPVEQLVDVMMQISDNVLTEAMARELAKATGNEQSFAGGVKAVSDVLTKNGFDLTGVELADGSGLSGRNKVPAKLLTDILAAAAKPDPNDQRTAKLRPLLTALPVAGGSGTLAKRYDSAAAQGRGWVRAKTGTLTSVNALTGVVVDKDGRLLVFAFLSGNPNDKDAVRQALDVLAATLRGCGCP